MNRKYLPYLLLLILVFPQLTFAHSGHSPLSFTGGMMHPFTGLDHILAMVAVGLWAVQMKGKALWILPLSFVSLMIAGGLLSHLGLVLPLVEPMILASILILGLLVTLSARAPLWLGTVLVGFFAIFHGYAHIAEIGQSSLVTYILGFSLATALLHIAGITAGLLGNRFSEKLVRIAGFATMVLGILVTGGM